MVMEIFSLIVLLVLVVAALAIWALLGMYPGKIAREGLIDPLLALP